MRVILHGILNRDYSIESLKFSSAFLYSPYTLHISEHIFLFSIWSFCFKFNGPLLDCVLLLTAFSFAKFKIDPKIYYLLLDYPFSCSFLAEVISDNIFRTINSGSSTSFVILLMSCQNRI